MLRSRWFAPVAVAFVLAAFVVLGAAGFLLNERLFDDVQRMSHVRSAQLKIADVLAHSTDAETGQRGYILTGDDLFLMPYWQSLRVLDGDLRELAELMRDDPEQAARLQSLQEHVAGKMAELAATIEMRQAGQDGPALARIRSGVGRELMDRIRADVEAMFRVEENRAAALGTRHQSTIRLLRAITLGGTAFAVGAVLVVGGSAFRRRRSTGVDPLPLRQFTAKYTVALATVAALALIGQLVIQLSLSRIAEDSTVLNLAGRQRMLSQRICKSALKLMSAEIDIAERRATLAELRGATDEFRATHRGLLDGDPELGLPGEESEAVRRYFAQMQPHFEEIASASVTILSAPTGGQGVPQPATIAAPARSILATESAFVSAMNDAVKQEEREAQDRVSTLRWTELIVLTGLLGVLLAEGAFVFRPAVRSLSAAYESLAGVTGRLQAVLDAATEIAIVATDETGAVTLFNRGAERILGRSAADAIGTQAPAFFVSPSGSPARLEDLIAGVSTGPIEVEATAKRADGETFPVRIVTTPVRDSAGSVTGYLILARDVTADRRAEDAMRTARLSAEAANRAKSEFLANMSHELRTPLNSVIGFSNILLKNKAGNLRDNDLTYLSRIVDNGKHLLGLINTILDLSKVEAGRMEAHREPTDVAALVAATVAQIQPQATEKGVELKAEVPAGLAPLNTDPGKLKQILINLMGNALRFTESGSVRVIVEAADPTRITRIDVRDTGIGIPLEKQKDIFEAFRQVETGSDRKYGGTGLGLTISRSLCELLGYKLVLADSAPGVGSCFRVELDTGPASRLPMPSPVANLPAVLPAPPSSRVRPARLRGLIVDDEPDAREVMTRLLEDLGLEVFAAADGPAGLEMAHTHRPDLILLDLMMPNMTGWEVMARLRTDERLRDIPVVIVSIVAGDSRSTLAGAADYVDKPASREDLARVLARTFPAAPGRVMVIEEGSTLATALDGTGPEVISPHAANTDLLVEEVENSNADAVLVDVRGTNPRSVQFLSAWRERATRSDRSIVVVSDGTPLVPNGSDWPSEVVWLVLPAATPAEQALRELLPRILGERKPATP